MISKQRLKELERAESKLNALEAGGVDNWEWYGESLKEYRKENEIEERMDSLVDELSQIFGECAYEPSERGAGIAFTDDIAESVIKCLFESKVTFSDLDEQ